MENLTKYSEFFKKIEYQFKDENLLKLALTHPSVNVGKSKGVEYQRLEFLGDRILSFVLGFELFKLFPLDTEGVLAKKFSYIASGKILSEISTNIDIPKYIILSSGEERFFGRSNKSNLENTLEALIGAIFLDSEIQTTKKFILQHWKQYLSSVNIEIATDSKSLLQEYSQGKFGNLPQYSIVEKTGSEHAPIFKVKVYVVGISGEFFGQGSSKKEAEKNAAENLMNFIKENQKKLD